MNECSFYRHFTGLVTLVNVYLFLGTDTNFYKLVFTFCTCKVNASVTCTVCRQAEAVKVQR